MNRKERALRKGYEDGAKNARNVPWFMVFAGPEGYYVVETTYGARLDLTLVMQSKGHRLAANGAVRAVADRYAAMKNAGR